MAPKNDETHKKCYMTTDEILSKVRCEKDDNCDEEMEMKRIHPTSNIVLFTMYIFNVNKEKYFLSFLSELILFL